MIRVNIWAKGSDGLIPACIVRVDDVKSKELIRPRWPPSVTGLAELPKGRFETLSSAPLMILAIGRLGNSGDCLCPNQTIGSSAVLSSTLISYV
jgi:hypothetical protein